MSKRSSKIAHLKPQFNLIGQRPNERQTTYQSLISKVLK